MVQGTFDDLGTPLSSVTFVVVDLETTGGSPAECGITEIGAVKVRGGEVVGEFQTLVNPGGPDPGVHLGAHRHHRRHGRGRPADRGGAAGLPRVRRRLGARRPQRRLRHLLPQGRGPAHRARVAGLPRPRHGAPGPPARAPRRGAQPPARLPRAGSSGRRPTPDHRALHDARATVDVLHGLLERVGSLGVHSLEELLDYTARVTPARRRKRHLADDLPDAARGLPLQGRPGPGALRRHLGLHPHPRALLLHRLGAPPPDGRDGAHRRVGEPHRLRHHPRGRGARAAPHRRAQAPLQPPLTAPGAGAVGQAHRRAVPPAVHRARRRRRRRAVCRPVRLPLGRRGRGRRRPRGAAAAPVPRTAVPDPAALGVRARRHGPVRRALHGCAVRRRLRRGRRPGRRAARRRHPRPARRAPRARMADLADGERFEDAQVVRERLVALVRGTSRSQRLDPLARIAELVAARRSLLGGWEVVCVRHGRLAGSTTARPAAPTRCRTSRRCAPAPRSSRAPVAPSHGRDAGGEREGPALARVPRRAHRRGRRRLDLPGGRCGPVRAELEPLETARREVAGFAASQTCSAGRVGHADPPRGDAVRADRARASPRTASADGVRPGAEAATASLGR